jgi:hypothetical protein
LIFIGLDLQVSGLDFDRGVDHGFVAAELKRQHEDQQQTGKGDSTDGQYRSSGIAPNIAPGHFYINAQAFTSWLFSSLLT